MLKCANKLSNKNSMANHPNEKSCTKDNKAKNETAKNRQANKKFNKTKENKITPKI